METVQLTCGHCGKLMAIAVQDLGSQVHCPHCRQVVQSPAAPPQPAPPQPADPMFSTPPVQERESIFSSAEEAGDDVFGGPPQSRLELPPSPAAPSTAPAQGSIRPVWGPKPAAGESPDQAMAVAADGPPAAAGDDATGVEGAAPPRRAPQSQVGFLLLIFLVPYSVIMTGAFVYMLYLYRSARAADPMEQMPDPNPKEGGAKRISYRWSPDHPLPDKLKTALGQPIRVGDVEVKPLKVELTDGGDLVLRLNIRNASSDAVFNPFPIAFARPVRGMKPYTFLQAGDHTIQGGDAEWFKGPPGHEKQLSDGNLRPGEEMMAQLSTSSDRDTRASVQRVLKTPGPLLWRLHVRRGLVEVRGEPVSATAVIGVRFTAHDVEHPHAAVAPPAAPVALRIFTCL